MTLVGEQKESKKDLNTRTAQLVELLTEIGPDIPEIARRLHQFKESVRYRYKEKIIGRGFAVQALVDHEKLGLRRVVFIVEFSDDYRQYANAILSAMNELCYVVHFAKTLPDGKYVVNASVPQQYVEDFVRLLEVLKERGLFSAVSARVFDWVRILPMRANFYDFNSGRWDFDWSTLASRDYAAASYTPSQPVHFDYTDLLILKELHMDANKSLTEIAEKLKINYKKLAWHHANHVLGRGLIKGYRIGWMGTRYNYKLEKALHRKHRYLAVDLMVANVSEYERMELMSKMNQLPFLWGEAGGSNYYAEFGFPVDSITEALQYLEGAIVRFRERSTCYIFDFTNSLSFTISYQLYDESRKMWTFDLPGLLSRFDNMRIKIKEKGEG